MGVTLNSTGVSFNDGTSQNSSAIAGGGVQVFTNSSTWTCPPGVSRVRYTLIGGGGGGGKAGQQPNGPGHGGGGGGAGGILLGYVNVNAGTVYNVTVGSGGTAGNSSNGGSGGATSFSNFATANGGAGGVGGTYTYGGAGTAGTAVANATWATDWGWRRNAASPGYSSSGTGYGGSAGTSPGWSNGASGLYGSGGAGGYNFGAGAAGAQGMAILEW